MSVVDQIRKQDLDLAAAEISRRYLHDFVPIIWPTIEAEPFVDNWHIGAMCEHLQAVTDGQIPKLIINVPPGTSKSLVTAVIWFCWNWGPRGEANTRWLFASYDQRLSTRDSVKCRAIIQSPFFQKHWPVQLTGDQNLKIYYENTARGWRLATTPSGHGTGEHPHYVVYDDLHNVQQAESEKELKSVHDWHDLTMPSRGAAIRRGEVILMQRLREDDITGYVLAREEGWVHLCLPMYYEPNRMITTPIGFNDPRSIPGDWRLTLQGAPEETLLDPNRYPPEMLDGNYGAKLGAYGRASQWQQRPSPREGGLFKRHYYGAAVKELPRFERVVRYWDLAATEEYERADSAATAGVLMGKRGERYVVIDVEVLRESPGGVLRAMKNTAERDEDRFGYLYHVRFEQEPGASGKQAALQTIQSLKGYRVTAEKPMGNKLVRAEDYAIATENGEVELMEAKWNDQFIDEHCDFPNGKFKDQVDAGSGAYRFLAAPRKDCYLVLKSEDGRNRIRRFEEVGQLLKPEGLPGAHGRPMAVDPNRCRRFAVLVTASTTAKLLEEMVGLGGSWNIFQIWDYLPDRRVYFLRSFWRTQGGWDEISTDGLRYLEEWSCRNFVISNDHHGPALFKLLKKHTPTLYDPIKVEDASELVEFQNLIRSGAVFIPEPSVFPAADGMLLELADWHGDRNEPYGQVAACALAAKHGSKTAGAWGGTAPGGSQTGLRW